MGRAPVGVVVTGVRRARVRAGMVRGVVALAVGASVAGVAPGARVEEMVAVEAPVAVGVATVTRAPLAPVSASSRS